MPCFRYDRGIKSELESPKCTSDGEMFVMNSLNLVIKTLPILETE